MAEQQPATRLGAIRYLYRLVILKRSTGTKASCAMSHSCTVTVNTQAPGAATDADSDGHTTFTGTAAPQSQAEHGRATATGCRHTQNKNTCALRRCLGRRYLGHVGNELVCRMPTKPAVDGAGRQTEVGDEVCGNCTLPVCSSWAITCPVGIVFVSDTCRMILAQPVSTPCAHTHTRWGGAGGLGGNSARCRRVGAHCS